MLENNTLNWDYPRRVDEYIRSYEAKQTKDKNALMNSITKGSKTKEERVQKFK